MPTVNEKLVNVEALVTGVNTRLSKDNLYNGLDQAQGGYALDARAAVKLDSRLGNIEEMAAASVGPAASVSIDYANAKDAPFVKLLLHVKIEQQGSGNPSSINVRPFVAQSNFAISIDTGSLLPQTISFRTMQGLYGGIIDLVNQKYIRVYGHISSYNGESLPGVWYSSKDVYTSGASPSMGAEVVYALATPVVESISVATFNMTPKTVHTITAGTSVSSVSASYLTEDTLLRRRDVDSTPTAGSSNPVSSGGVATAIQQSTAITGDSSNVTMAANVSKGNTSINKSGRLCILTLRCTVNEQLGTYSTILTVDADYAPTGEYQIALSGPDNKVYAAYLSPDCILRTRSAMPTGGYSGNMTYITRS